MMSPIQRKQNINHPIPLQGDPGEYEKIYKSKKFQIIKNSY